MSRLQTELERLGHTPKSLEEAQRDTLWWVYARVQALLNRRPLVGAHGLAWTAAGYTELVPIEVARPGRGRVSVRVVASAVSPGTERAQYLHLPNAAIGVLGRPGYSAAGLIAAVGPGVVGIAVGDRVAVWGAAHASLVTVPAAQVVAVPPGVSASAAALVQLGVICGQGVRRAALVNGQPFAVVGTGPVGALALRLAARHGTPAAVVAASRAKQATARLGGARRFLATDDAADAAEVASLGLPVVIEATGDPQAVPTAIAAAGPGGRVVLLGSPRGVTTAFPISEVRGKGLELVGAHVDTIDAGEADGGTAARRRLAAEFLAAVADGLDVADLAGEPVDPRDAPRFYRRLAHDRSLVGAHFDWTALARTTPRRAAPLLSVPNVSGRGMERKWPLPPGGARRPRPALLELGDPFANAAGMLSIGLIGCGDIAVSNAAAIAAAPNTRLAACFDPVPRLADDLARRHGAVSLPTVEAMLGDPAVDAVFLAVPHHLHAPIAMQAAAAGKHVIVEKPPANDLAAAVAMTDAARRAGVVLSVCFPQRYEPAVVLARRLVEAGAIGEATGTMIRLSLDKSPAYWLGGFSGRSVSTWRSSRERAGGGVLIMNLSHHLDLMRHLTGLDVTEVTAVAAAVDEPSEVEDTVALTLRYANGAVGALIASSAVRGTTETDLGLWGRDGHIVVEPRPRVYTLQPLDGLRTARWQTFGALPGGRGRAVFVSRLASAIARGHAADITPEDGLAVQALIEAAYRSSDERRPLSPAAVLAEGRDGGPERPAPPMLPIGASR